MLKEFNLQLFAEEVNDSNSDENGNNGVDIKETEKTDNKDKNKGAEKQYKYTDEDVDKILNDKFKVWQKKQEKAVDEAKKLADMNATQKAEYERDKLQKELEELQKKDSLFEMTKTARKMLDTEGIIISDDLLSVMVTTDAEETKTNIDSFAKTFKEEVEKAVKDKLKGDPPKKGSGGGSTPMTKDEIMKIKDPELRQAKMLENKELFNF